MKNNLCHTDSKIKVCAYNWGLLILRLVLGGFMLTHGIPKLMNFSQLSQNFIPVLGSPSLGLILIIGAEVFCTIAIILGLFTRLAAIPPIIGMLVATIAVHGSDPFRVMELPLLYASMFAVIALVGAGKFSLDYLIGKKYCKKTQEKQSE